MHGFLAIQPYTCRKLGLNCIWVFMVCHCSSLKLLSHHSCMSKRLLFWEVETILRQPTHHGDAELAPIRARLTSASRFLPALIHPPSTQELSLSWDPSYPHWETASAAAAGERAV